MTLEEACLYLNMNPDDDDINLDQLEKNYHDKLRIYNPSKFKVGSPEYNEAKRKRAIIEEACDYLLDIYTELHPDNVTGNENNSRSNFFMKAALFAACVVTLCCLAGTAYFVNVYQSEKSEKEQIAKNFAETLNELNESEAMHQKKYETLLKEIEELRVKTDEMSAAQAAQKASNVKQEELIKTIMPAIVYIETDRKQGSGFFVSSGGDILTNHHVIEKAGQINITTNDNRRFNALVKDYNQEKDIALLAVKSSGKFPFLRISQSQPQQGQTVIAIGNPKGYRNSVSIGIVSALRKMNNNSWVQFSAPVSPGSSGGALINLNGEVVGIPTLIRTDGQNLNFAVAPDVMNKFVKSAKNKSARSNLPQLTGEPKNSGISLPDSRGFLAHKWGCTLGSVKRYVSSPLLSINSNGTLYKSFSETCIICTWKR